MDQTRGRTKTDIATGAEIGMDLKDSRAISGDLFLLNTSDADADTADVNSIYIKPADSGLAYIAYIVCDCTGLSTIALEEAPTVTANTGTNGQAIYNLNRNSAKTLDVYDNATTPVVNKYGKNVTISAAGTIITLGSTASGNPHFESGPIVLKPNTVYAIKNTAGALNLVLNMNVYITKALL